MEYIFFLYSSNTDRNKTNDDSSKNVNGMVLLMVAMSWSKLIVKQILVCNTIMVIWIYHDDSNQCSWIIDSNPFFLLLKLPQIKKIGLEWHFQFFLVGHNSILNCGNWKSIGEQDGETMGSTPY